MLSLCPMGRIIAIDYGRKRTGLAVTDTLQMIANGLTTVPSGELVKFLADYVSRPCLLSDRDAAKTGTGRSN